MTSVSILDSFHDRSIGEEQKRRDRMYVVDSGDVSQVIEVIVDVVLHEHDPCILLAVLNSTSPSLVQEVKEMDLPESVFGQSF